MSVCVLKWGEVFLVVYRKNAQTPLLFKFATCKKNNDSISFLLEDSMAAAGAIWTYTFSFRTYHLPTGGGVTVPLTSLNVLLDSGLRSCYD